MKREDLLGKSPKMEGQHCPVMITPFQATLMRSLVIRLKQCIVLSIMVRLCSRLIHPNLCLFYPTTPTTTIKTFISSISGHSPHPHNILDINHLIKPTTTGMLLGRSLDLLKGRGQSGARKRGIIRLVFVLTSRWDVVTVQKKIAPLPTARTTSESLNRTTFAETSLKAFAKKAKISVNSSMRKVQKKVKGTNVFKRNQKTKPRIRGLRLTK